jgi:fibronectin type 3 domain-containing protein
MTTSRALVAALLTLLVAAPASHAQSNGLVAAYGFEEPSGSAATDSSEAGNTGTLLGATRSAAGRFGAALSFDGVDDRVDVADAPSLDVATGMTLEAWVRPQWTGWRTVVMKERSGGLAYLLYASTDTNRPSTEVQLGSTAEARGTATLPANVWTHLASTYDGATLRLYVNGTQVASRAASGAITATSSPLRIGGNTVWGEHFRGLIDEVRVYNRGLTAGEIQTDMGTAIIPADAEPPSAPTGLTATASGDDVHLAWGAATDNVGVTGYRVYLGGILYRTLPGTTRSFDDVDVAPGTRRYVVRAIDNAGHMSPMSNEEVVTIAADTEPPTAPELTATVEGSDVRLTWTEASDERGVVSYSVYRNYDGDRNIAFLDADTREYVDRGLPNGTFRYYVMAEDGAGNYQRSNLLDVHVGPPDLEPPTAPVLTVEVTGTSAHLTWTPSTDDQAIKEYTVWRNDQLISFVGPTTHDAWFSNLALGTYRFKVRANDTSEKASAFSNEVVVTIAEAPPVLSFTKPDGNDVHLTWTAPTGGVVVSTYRIYRDGTLIHTRGATSPREFDESNLAPGTYRYRVDAVDSSNRVWASNVSDVEISQDTSPPSGTFSMACDGTTVHDYVDVRGTLSDDRGPLTWRAEVDGRTIAGPSTTLSSSAGFRFEWETRDFANGPHAMTLVVRDAAGNETVTEPCRWTVHNPVVTVPFTSLNDGDTVRGTVKVTAVPHGDGEPLPAGWPITGVAFGGALAGSDSTGPYETTWDTTKVADGVYTLTAAVHWMDYSLPRATNSIRVTVNNTPEAPTGLRANIQYHNEVLLGWDDAPEGVVSEYRVYRDGALLGAPTSSWYYDTGLQPGTYRYTVVVVGPRGTSPAAEIEVTIAPDTTPPQVYFEYGCGGTRKYHDIVTIIPSVYDERGGNVAVHAQLDGQRVYERDFTFPRGDYRFTALVWHTRRDNVANGLHEFVVTARDAAGNETTKTCVLNVHNMEVTLPMTSPADEATVRGTVTVAAEVLGDGVPWPQTWQGWVLYANPLKGVTFTLPGGTSHVDSTAPYELAWDTTTVPDGTYTVQAQVNWNDYGRPPAPTFPATTIDVTVDNPPPAPIGVTATVTGDDVDVTWTAAAGATEYRVFRGTDRIATVTGTSHTDADRPPGTYEYTVVAVDAAGAGPSSQAARATVADATPPPGLVAAYGFEHSSGTTAADSSGTGSTGTIAGAASVAGGRFGRALSFDGVDDMVTVADSSPLDLAPGMTLSAWVKPTTVDDWRTVLLKERPGSLAYALYAATDNGRPMTEISASGMREARAPAALPVGVWTHLAATYDRTTLRLYVDGAQVASTAHTAALTNSAGALRIGGNSVWGEWFGGLIDEVRVYERALSAAEIQADRDRAVVPGT